MERDESFIRRYLTEDLCIDLNLFEYRKSGSNYVITEVADEEGWKSIRDSIATTVGMNSIPSIKVVEVTSRDHSLILEHEYDDRELNLVYAYETLKHISELWKNKVHLRTVIGSEKKTLLCDEEKKISVL